MLCVVRDVASKFEQIRAALRAAGASVVVSPSVAAPDGCGHVVVPLDGDALATTRALVDSLSPRLVLLGEGDERGFDGHLVGAPWVRIMYMTPSAIREIEESLEGEDDAAQRLDADDTALLRSLTERLGAEVGFSDHGGASEVTQLLRTRVREATPAEAERILAAGRFELWELGAELLRTLKDRHAAHLRNHAREYAQRILDEEGPFSAPFLRAAQRDVAYRYLKRIDPTCTTRASSDPVALELGALWGAAQ